MGCGQVDLREIALETYARQGHYSREEYSQATPNYKQKISDFLEQSLL